MGAAAPVDPRGAPCDNARLASLFANGAQSMHVLCPSCYASLELESLTPAEEVVCSSCGSSFRLAGGSTLPATLPDSGRRLGRFEILHVVGTGSFGTVYKARETQFDNEPGGG
jgi:hypothetical protein